MSSFTYSLRRGGGGEEKCLADEQLYQANNNRDITEKQTRVNKETKKQTKQAQKSLGNSQTKL